MAAAATNKLFMEIYGQPEKEQNMNLLYSSYNTSDANALTTEQLQAVYERMRNTALSIPQIEASLRHVCSGYPDFHDCDEEELLDVLDEMDRRCFLAKDLQWEFAMLDRQGKGAIAEADAKFLFKMVHGEFFSEEKFNELMGKRLMRTCDVTFQEIEVELCNIPTYQWIKEKRAEEKKQKEKERKEMEKAKEEERRIMEMKKREQEALLAKQAELERKEEDNRRLEEERKEAERRAEEKKLEEEKAKKKEEEKSINQEKEQQRQEEEQRRQEEEQQRQEEEQHRRDEEERLRQEEVERLKLEEEAKRIKQEEEVERLRKEDEIHQAEEAERLKQEENRLAEEEKQKKEEQARENWKELKDLGVKQLLPDDLQTLHKMKETREEKEAVEEEQSAEAIAEAEDNAENEFQQAEEMLNKAISEEERIKAEEAKEKARQEALKNKEKRLRLQLNAAVKLKNRPKLVVSIDEAKESKITELNPDIDRAEKVSDSIKCGEDLEDAMVNRDLPLIVEAVAAIKTKKYEKDHVVRILEADKLIDKLKRLEKSKKDILELNQRTISEIRSYSQPLPAIHEVMVATYMILGYKEKELKEWKFIQALLGRSGKEGLKRMCTQLKCSDIDLSIAKNAEKKYLNRYTLESITDISAGIGTFYNWSTVMIEEARNWVEDAEFRKEVEAKRKMESEETKKLQEKKKSRAPTKTPTKTPQKGRKKVGK